MAGWGARIAVLAGFAGLILGIVLTRVSQGGESAPQSGAERRVIRPEKAPNTGLPFSPAIMAGNTLYFWVTLDAIRSRPSWYRVGSKPGHARRWPIWAKS